MSDKVTKVFKINLKHIHNVNKTDKVMGFLDERKVFMFVRISLLSLVSSFISWLFIKTEFYNVYFFTEKPIYDRWKGQCNWLYLLNGWQAVGISTSLNMYLMCEPITVSSIFFIDFQVKNLSIFSVRAAFLLENIFFKNDTIWMAQKVNEIRPLPSASAFN